MVETEDYVVELMLTSTSDMELTQPTEANYGAVLHRYHAEGTHHRVDLRRAIRKQLRQVRDILYYAITSEPDSLLNVVAFHASYISLTRTLPPHAVRLTQTERISVLINVGLIEGVEQV